MRNLFQIADVGYQDDGCRGLGPVIRIVKKGIFPIVQIGIPILLLVFGTVDLGKAVISSDDKEVKAAQSRLIKRVIYAVAVFFIATIVSIVMNLVATANAQESDASSWSTCWNNTMIIR